MGILSKAIRPEMNHNYVGAPSFRTHNPYFNLFDCYYADEYASQFPNIRPIANEYMKIRPYAIGSNGEPVSHAVIDALYHPNKQDSSVLFAEKIAVSTLSLPITYILVWRNQGGEARPGGPFGVRGRNVAGFTFLENPSIDVRDGRKYYRIGSQEFTEDDVMELPGGAKPGNLYAGYSPSQAASRWSTLDSYIADFQKGFFENGAVPAGQFVITAVSEQDFKDTVKKMQDSHRGAGKNNNVTYTPRPIDPNTQKPADAKIEWIPYQQSNKDIDFRPLLEHVDNRLSEAYGVSGIIKGVDSQATYNNAEVSENGFAKRAVEPLALRNYTQITHELNRITGGLGVAITYKYQIPAISDAELVKAQTKQVEVNMINALIAQGFTLDSAVDALELSNAYKLLQIGEETRTNINNDKPDVDEGDEVADAPDPTKIDGVTPLNKFEAGGIIHESDETIGDNSYVVPKGTFDKLEAATRPNPKAELTDEQKIAAATRQYMQSQVDRAVREYREEVTNQVQPEPDESELDRYVDDMYAIIAGILVAYGQDQYAAGAAISSLALDDLQGFFLTETAQDEYRGYLRRVGTSYGQDTAESIRRVLARSNEEQLTRAQTEDALRNIMNTDEWRVDRLARTELNRSQSMGGLEGMKRLTAEVGVQYEKSLSHAGSSTVPCEFCQAYEGIWFPLDDPMLGFGQAVQGVDGGLYVNDFATLEAGDIHPNGKGTVIYREVQQ